MVDPAHAVQALQAFDLTKPGQVQPLGSGLINDTFAVSTADGQFVLQRVHPVFAAEIHHNIAAVTEHLRARGVTVPTLVRTRDRAPWTTVEGRAWRLMTRLEGVSLNAVQSPAQAYAAGQTLGRFHGGLDDLEYEFVGMRQGVHDTPQHLRNLEAAVAQHPSHRLRDSVLPLADGLLKTAQELPAVSGLRDRVVHGDPKFNNILFRQAHGQPTQSVGLIDLDTVGPMPLHLELGDAWRSWCNPRGENVDEARFDLDIFEASLAGYADADPFDLTGEEVEALLLGVEWITLELSARFLADALVESYFRWDAQRFPAAGEHNLMRARGQWSLHHAAKATRADRESILHRSLRSRRVTPRR